MAALNYDGHESTKLFYDTSYHMHTAMVSKCTEWASSLHLNYVTLLQYALPCVNKCIFRILVKSRKFGAE